MGRLRVKKRQHQIKSKQKRKAKLAKLRQAYLKAKSKEDKEKILEKVSKIASWLSEEEFLAPLKLKKTSKKTKK